MTTKQHLLIIYHSKDGSTGKMAAAVEQGASHPDMDIELKLILARDAGLEELQIGRAHV